MPYLGTPPSWGHRLQAAHVPVLSIGKLHYKDDEDLCGFDRQINPMHVTAGIGDLLGSMREPLQTGMKGRSLARKLGPGDTPYIRYDRSTAQAAVDWLQGEARQLTQPWVLYVGFVAPHFPLIAPPEFFALYPPEEMPLPKAYRPEEQPRHPWLDALRQYFVFDNYFDDEKRRLATASYFGLCSFLDHNVGRIMDAVEAAGLGPATRIVYTSDHGENLGARGLWGKSNGFEETVGIPLIMSGPGVPQGRVVETPVSLIDVFPTILEAAGVAPQAEDRSLSGTSLFGLAEGADRPERHILSEYHAAGSISALYVIRQGAFKYLHYTGLPPQLFDLEADPEELHNLAGDPAQAVRLGQFEALLRSLLDPEAVDARAKRDQRALIDRHGGREQVVARGTFDGTPAPGETAEFFGAASGAG
jgi:choline-sulfatase